MTRWPHQTAGLAAVKDAIGRKVPRTLVTSPTGGGKGKMIADLVAWAADEMVWRVAVYSNRRLLTTQTSDVLLDEAIEHGVRAAGHRDRRHLPVQVCSIQTEGARSVRREPERQKPLHDCRMVVVDEAHLYLGDEAREVIAKHVSAGAAVVGFTATPIGLGEHYDELIVAGTNSELRSCGALVTARHFGPEEPDAQLVGYVQVGDDPTERQCVGAMGRAGTERLFKLFGRVLDHWTRLNPRQRPTILFAPGVAESVWFAQEFVRAGYPAAHIDGANLWVDGELVPTSQEARDDLLGRFARGDIKVLSNRFVLREGVNVPQAECGLLCTIFGSLQSYLQACGRLLRACPESEKVDATLIDFGGNWHRHGSVNADREWDLDCTAGMVAGMRVERLRARKEPEPFPCPQCSRVMLGRTCPECKWVAENWTKVRPVVQIDGTLVLQEGDIYEPRRVAQTDNWLEDWKQCYWRTRKSKSRKSFREAFGLFAKEHWGYFPRPEWEYMPAYEMDQWRPVADVPMSRLMANGEAAG